MVGPRAQAVVGDLARTHCGTLTLSIPLRGAASPDFFVKFFGGLLLPATLTL
jgi:hypothetical protein